jgi:SIR2-like domain
MGLEDIPGPTVIEMKRSMGQEFARRLREIFLWLLPAIPVFGFKSLLLIVGETLQESDRERILRLLKRTLSGVTVRIWDVQDLQVRAQAHANALSAVLPKVPSIAMGDMVSRSAEASVDQWKTDRVKHIEELRRAYRANDLILVLGAGVSMSAGIPDWNTLVSGLLILMIKENLPPKLESTDAERLAIASRLRELQGTTPLLEARYIRSGLKEPFETAVSKLLYANSDKAKEKSSILLRSLARLCVPRRSGVGLKSVVTYNFDDLLEQQLSELGIPFRAIYRDGDFSDQDELSVYHVHGFLPRDPAKYEKVADSLLVFSEERYHSLMVEPYSWANLIQLTAFRESTCLFVGLSLTDPNLRRLLDIAAKSNKSPRHFAILKRLEPKSLSYPRKKAVRPDVLQAFASAHHDLQEASLRELGVNVIWIKDHDEITTITDALVSKAVKLGKKKD